MQQDPLVPWRRLSHVWASLEPPAVWSCLGPPALDLGFVFVLFCFLPCFPDKYSRGETHIASHPTLTPLQPEGLGLGLGLGPGPGPGPGPGLGLDLTWSGASLPTVSCKGAAQDPKAFVESSVAQAGICQGDVFYLSSVLFSLSEMAALLSALGQGKDQKMSPFIAAGALGPGKAEPHGASVGERAAFSLP